jgi:glycosyltransferase involved in cell wall biosynthesis
MNIPSIVNDRPRREVRDRPSPTPSWLDSRAGDRVEPGSVLIHAPSHVFQAPGGGEVQLVQTARHLEELGLRVRPFSPWLDRLEGARLLHLFGMSREGLELARIAKSRRAPVVLSPICWFEPRALWALAPSRARAGVDLAKWAARALIPRLPCWRRELLGLCDQVLPNSRAEADQLITLFGLDASRIHVVPNGVSSRFASAGARLFQSRHGEDPFVLYCGRVEPRKNVLGLIRAMAGLKRRLVIFGDVVPGDDGYGRACLEAGRGFLQWEPRLDHDDPLLASAYAAARVFALPSWFETPGLAALEAALAGCAVVITPWGCTREYFGGSAHYARPDRPREIGRAIARAWEAGPDPQLREQIGTRFSWSIVARETAEAYDEISA